MNRIIKPKPNWNGLTKWRIVYSEIVFGCCDCGLAHRFYFKVKNNRIYWRAKRDKKETLLIRKKYKNEKI